jgi:hypothetical protein
MEESGYSRLVGGDKQGGEECEWFGFHFFGFQVVLMMELLGLLECVDYTKQ